MRTIKFRIWDKDLGMDYNPKLGMANNDLNNQFATALGDLMQFTGLLDKKGKEIYEGDIVKCHDHPTGVDDSTGSVYWESGRWKVTGTIFQLGDFGTAWTEVIGNIYESPSLIN